MRRLIINADDFGLTEGVNRAIVEGHRDGIITSATLMANARAFDHAVSEIKSLPPLLPTQLSVGCHIVLIDGSPVLAPGVVPSLLAANSPDPSQFRSRLSSFARAALLGRIHPDEIAAEAAAQIKKIQSAGVAVSHIDSHKHTHMFPKIARPLLRAAKECGVRAIRNPFTAFGAGDLARVAARPGLCNRYLQLRALAGFHQNFRRSVSDAGLVTTDGICGVIDTGSLNHKSFAAIMEKLPQGTWELVCHPGYDDPDLARTGTRLLSCRSLELEVLTSSEARQTITRNGIELISFSDL